MLFADKIDHPELKKLYQRWFGKGPKYSYADFSPLDFKEFLPHLFLMDVHRNPISFGYRLVGTEIDRQVGRPLTGMRVEEFRRGKTLDDINNLFTKVADEGACGYYKSRLGTENNPHTTYYRLALPLYGENGQIDVILGGWYAHFEEGQVGTMIEFEGNGASSHRLSLELTNG